MQGHGERWLDDRQSECSGHLRAFGETVQPERKEVEEEEETSRNLALMWIPHQDDFQHNFTDLTSLHPELSDIC